MEDKTIAVVVGDRQGEALRMSIGLTILDDKVDIFMIRPLDGKEDTLFQVEGARELGLNMFSTVEGTEFVHLSVDDLAHKLLAYDRVLPY